MSALTLRAGALSGADVGGTLRLREGDVEVAGRLETLVHYTPSAVDPERQLHWVFVRIRGVVPEYPRVPNDLRYMRAADWTAGCFCLSPLDLVDVERVQPAEPEAAAA